VNVLWYTAAPAVVGLLIGLFGRRAGYSVTEILAVVLAVELIAIGLLAVAGTL
jgi:hypothetical protein